MADKLYHELADIYEAMYQTFIDYEEEFCFYNEILTNFQKGSVLEIGSGTGNLAKYFLANGRNFIGLDSSKEMISIANKKVPNGIFLHDDMRSFSLEAPVESVIITGRTISYLLKNVDLLNAFESIARSLNSKGLLVFDFIDANKFIPSIVNGKNVEHRAFFENNSYLRKSKWTLILKDGMDFKWTSEYFKKEDDIWKIINQDVSTIRTFTLDEMKIFLEINNFEVVEAVERNSYAFPTIVIKALRKV